MLATKDTLVFNLTYIQIVQAILLATSKPKFAVLKDGTITSPVHFNIRIILILINKIEKNILKIKKTNN